MTPRESWQHIMSACSAGTISSSNCRITASGLVRLATELDIGLVATNDVHYLRREDAAVQKALLCIQTATTLAEPSPLCFPTEEFYLKSEDEMKSLFAAVPQAIENTARIADRCRVELHFGELKLPAFDAPGGDSNA